MNIYDIPIINYHKVSTKKEIGITTITPEKFREQMQYLSTNGYSTITFKKFDSENNLPEKSIIISFDDTYKSIYKYAFPILKEYNYIAVLFVISAYIGKKNDWEAYQLQRKHFHASKDDIHEMQEYGFEIGSHGKTHKFLPYLNQEKLQSELQESKFFLDNIFNTNIITCCYPYGGYNEKAIEIAQSAGYKYGTGNLKLNNTQSNDKLRLQRRSIYSIDSLNSFCKKVSSPQKINLNFLKEWSIQKGSFAGVIKNKYI